MQGREHSLGILVYDSMQLDKSSLIPQLHRYQTRADGQTDRHHSTQMLKNRKRGKGKPRKKKEERKKESEKREQKISARES